MGCSRWRMTCPSTFGMRWKACHRAGSSSSKGQMSKYSHRRTSRSSRRRTSTWVSSLHNTTGSTTPNRKWCCRVGLKLANMEYSPHGVLVHCTQGRGCPSALGAASSTPYEHEYNNTGSSTCNTPVRLHVGGIQPTHPKHIHACPTQVDKILPIRNALPHNPTPSHPTPPGTMCPQASSQLHIGTPRLEVACAVSDSSSKPRPAGTPHPSHTAANICPAWMLHPFCTLCADKQGGLHTTGVHGCETSL